MNEDKIIRTEETGNFEIWCDNGQCGFVIASFDTKEEAERKVNEWNKDGDAKYSLCERGE